MRLSYSLLSVTLINILCNPLAYSKLMHTPARLDANIYSSTEYAGFEADGLIHVIGDAEHTGFIDLQTNQATNSQWYSGIGVGYRQLINEAGIVGAYIYGDRVRIEPKSYFSVISPGLEYLGSRWDIRFNGYFPVGRHHHVLAENYGEYFGLNTVSFSGHSKSDSYLAQTIQVGSGGDLSIGVQPIVSIPVRTTLSAYTYQIKNADPVNGITLGAEYGWTPRWYVTARYSYDNLNHSTAAISLGVRLGGAYTRLSSHAVQQRISDRIERYPAQLGRGSGLPDRIVYRDATARLLAQNPNLVLGPNGQIVLPHSIWFFDQNVRDASSITSFTQCTFEQPCGPDQFNQGNVTSIGSLDSNATLYFNGGVYLALGNPSSRAAAPTGLVLASNQVLESRTSNFQQTASLDQQTIFYGGFQLSGNDALNNISVQQGGGVTTGVIANAGFNVIQNSNIGDDSYAYDTGLSLLSNSLTSISDSNVWANHGGVFMTITAAGLFNRDNIQVVGEVEAESFIYGIILLSSNQANLNQTQIQVTNQATDKAGNTRGIYLENHSLLTLQNSRVEANSKTASSAAVLLLDQARILVQNSQLSALSQTGSIGISRQAQSVVTVQDNSNITARSVNGNATGIRSFGNANGINSVIDSTQIFVESPKGMAVGISPSTGSLFTVGNLLISVNGSNTQPFSSSNGVTLSGSVVCFNGGFSGGNVVPCFP